MAIYRMYTGSDGQSHLEEQTIAAHPVLSQERPTVHIQFRDIAGGSFVDWHPAPRRQYVIVLAGQLELGFKDGTTRRLNPGDATLAEDTTGSGHTTRVVSAAPAVTAIVPLAG
jgi:quercetin dioxygenase-like cupin family protein